jgi:hypothetical protein
MRSSLAVVLLFEAVSARNRIRISLPARLASWPIAGLIAPPRHESR